MVWVQVYDFGENLDDKLVSAISGKFFLAKLDGQIALYNEIIDKCRETSFINSCEARYMYRADTLSNYLLPSLSIRFLEFFFVQILDPLDVGKVLSLAFFYGHAIIFLSACAASILFTNYLNNKPSKILTLFSLIGLTVSNPNLFDLSSFSSIFFNVVDSYVHPTVYVPRGAISILLFPISLAILFNKPKSLLGFLLLSSLTHAGYSQIISLVCLGTVFFLALIQDYRYFHLFILLTIYNAILLIFIYLQLSFGGSEIISISFENFSLGPLFETINFEIALFYLFCAFVIFSRRPEILKRATIILFSFHIFLLLLHLLSTLGVLYHNTPGSNISDRMNGSFMYIIFTYTLFVLGAEIYFDLASKDKYSYLIAFVLVIFLFVNINIMNVFISLKSVLSYQFASTQISRIFDSHNRFEMAKRDIEIYINNNYQIDGNRHWLSKENNILKLDIQKIKKLEVSQIDVNNEFLTFLYLYKADKMNP